MLKIDHVTKRFGSFTAVNDLTMEIPDKQRFGLLGANGAGKTTTFRMILGLLNA
ncbi:ATP-binding cassette domain-containing protein, partial [Bacillus licheniformis]|uniref:ATP-binding cassette domain-containing protein n=1 Tax=Bacillus licheniformis TaxID=1402 RepID=UPI0034A01B61